VEFIVRLLIAALSLGVAAYIVPGMYVDDFLSLLIAAFLLGIVNAFVKPIIVLLTLPVTVLTLGLFLMVINAAMLGVVAWVLPGFSLDGFLPALLGWLILALVSWIAGVVYEGRAGNRTV